MFLYIVLLLVLFVSGYLLYKLYKKKQTINKDYVENNEYKEKAENDTGMIYIFHAKWCPHSRKTLEKMKTIKKAYPKLTFNEIDSEKNVDMADTYKIVSYPTIVLLYNNETYYYEAELEENTFKTFINTIMK